MVAKRCSQPETKMNYSKLVHETKTLVKYFIGKSGNHLEYGNTQELQDIQAAYVYTWGNATPSTYLGHQCKSRIKTNFIRSTDR